MTYIVTYNLKGEKFSHHLDTDYVSLDFIAAFVRATKHLGKKKLDNLKSLLIERQEDSSTK